MTSSIQARLSAARLPPRPSAPTERSPQFLQLCVLAWRGSLDGPWLRTDILLLVDESCCVAVGHPLALLLVSLDSGVLLPGSSTSMTHEFEESAPEASGVH